MNDMGIGILPALPEDVPVLVKLVNSAYRGTASKKGWTTEADLLDGVRINEEMLTGMMTKGDAVVLKYSNEAGVIEGCVYLERQDGKLYLGLLTVSPEIQAKGIGKRLLAAADRYAVQEGLKSIFMTVISVRQELIDWYERYGYRKTGEKRPFPADSELVIAKQPLELLILEKEV